jgi:hypothetical protein
LIGLERRKASGCKNSVEFANAASVNVTPGWKRLLELPINPSKYSLACAGREDDVNELVEWVPLVAVTRIAITPGEQLAA